MAYSSQKSPRRANFSNPATALKSDIKTSGKESNQEQFSGNGSKAVKPSTSGGGGRRYSDTDRELGTRMQLATNGKGTADLKNPLNSYRMKVYAAAQNPDPVQNRAGVNKAPGRRSPTSAPTI